MRILPFLLGLLLFSHCKDKASNTSDSTATTEPATQTAPAQTAPAATPLPSIPTEVMERLWNDTDYIDYVFYTTNFSMNQSDINAIRNTLSGISKQNVALNPNCQAIGRLFFVIEGVNEVEADIIFTKECQYYAFMVDGEYKYANAMTDAGVQAYNNIFSKVSTMKAPQGGQ